LNKINKKQEKDIKNLREGINILKNNTGNFNSEYSQKNSMNEKIISNLAEEKKLKNILKSRLKKKDSELNKLSREFTEINITLNELEENINKIRYEYNNTNDEINILNNDYIKETSKKIQTENNNKKLNEEIKINQKEIKKLIEENNNIKKNNTNLSFICNNLQNKNNAYKKYIITMTEQNGILSQELENILNNDENIVYKFTRTEYLKNIKEENRDIISNSLNELKNHFIQYGNMGANFDCSVNNTDLKNNNKIYLNTYNTINIDNNNELKTSNNSVNNNIDNNLLPNSGNNPDLINAINQNENKINKENEYNEEKQNINENLQNSGEEEQENIEELNND